ncbi:hypothetical protein UFOVP1307_47 [uncultured Caudovirales phage]|uniref:Uncharacterized protein n=1 Tax=uncultured Caudovirales phage TaxID=2100421 RepID=A0A6J5PIM5_9CAUD|nr:hypothetical protein UFOVP651_76 [uncultured Caudovirales phage]CAB4170967.1 hypothetical protein UFOVP902_155 [uncultured Caudovirales phage]CAB4198071.1 hypothetical protein UFOVP1307_47 [uncultured Caudovirales phage]
MTKSINQPWAITEEFRTRYGKTWAELDFQFQDKISQELFASDPMNVLIGELHVAGNRIPMRYKDLIAYAKSIEILSNNLYAERVGKTETFEVSIKGRESMLNKCELGRLSNTLTDTVNTCAKAYELGLYL